MSDELGDRMKLYEGIECDRRFMPLLPVVARVDGRNFSKFTRGMHRPFDLRMSQAMVDTAKSLIKETNCCMAYTQSDEITLVWHSIDIKSQIWFDGRIAKMTSQLAAQATLWFNEHIARLLPEFKNRRPTFDARIWQTPNRMEAVNVFVWREWDATKNSISMAASEVYSAKQLHGKNGSQKQEMLFEKGINWNDYPVYFKRGTYIQKQVVSKPFDPAEIDHLPPKHAARTNPNLIIERSVINVMEMPIITSVVNRESVIFDGAEPELEP